MRVSFGGSVVEIEFHASHITFEVGHVRTFECCPRFCRCFRHNVLHLRCNRIGITSGSRRYTAIKGGSCGEYHLHFGGIFHFYAFLGHGHCPSSGHHLHTCVVIYCGEFASKRHLSVFVILGVRRIDIFSCHQGKTEVELVATRSFIVGSHHVVWRRREIATFVFRTGFVGEVDTANTAFDVEETIIIEGLFVGGVEIFTEVVHKDTTEVVITSVVANVSGRTCPNGFLVELDLIHLNSSKKTCSEVTVTQGKRVFHPRIGYPHSRFYVPKREGTFGIEGIVGGIDIFLFGKFVAIGRIGRSRHIVRKGKIERVVDICVAPKANLLAYACTTEGVERISAIAFARNHIISFAKIGTIENRESLCFGCLLHTRHTVVLVSKVVTIFAAKHKVVFCTDKREELCVILATICRRQFSICAFVHEFYTAIFETNVVVGGSF